MSAKEEPDISLKSMDIRLRKIRDRIDNFESRLGDLYKTSYTSKDEKEIEIGAKLFSLGGMTDTISSIEYILDQCENCLTKIVG